MEQKASLIKGAAGLFFLLLFPSLSFGAIVSGQVTLKGNGWKIPK
jgi:hypothetical protein